MNDRSRAQRPAPEMSCGDDGNGNVANDTRTGKPIPAAATHRGRPKGGRRHVLPRTHSRSRSRTDTGNVARSLVAAQEINADLRVVFLDFEDDEGGIVGWLLAMGAGPAAIREHFSYV